MESDKKLKNVKDALINLEVLGKRMKKMLEGILDSHGLSYNEYIFLYYLSDKKKISQYSLSKYFLTSRQKINKYIKKLEHQGYIDLSLVKNNKRNLKYLQVTEKGMELLRSITMEAERNYNDESSNLEEGRIVILVDLLKEINNKWG